MLEPDDPPLILDVRTRAQYEQDKSRIPGAIRVRPDEAEEWAGTRRKSAAARFRASA